MFRKNLKERILVISAMVVLLPPGTSQGTEKAGLIVTLEPDRYYVEHGDVDRSSLNRWWRSSDRVLPNANASNLEFMQVIPHIDGYRIRVQYKPKKILGKNGSSSTIWGTKLPPAQCAAVEQTVLLEGEGFDYGGALPYQTIKLGFGLGGGRYNAGGGGLNPCGWSLRWVVTREYLYGYSYAFGRTSQKFGSNIKTGVRIEPNQEYFLKMKVCLNSAGEADGSYSFFVDNVLVASGSDQVWMDHTQCDLKEFNSSDYAGMSTFYGGTNHELRSWWPDTTQYIQYGRVKYELFDLY